MDREDEMGSGMEMSQETVRERRGKREGGRRRG
jgi:hypothetical protein